ncbi:hypothetical protein I4U23_031348 [Adineta vaga]|nr:hypothetical protein I4U23_031348 [Adineta vaga]
MRNLASVQLILFLFLSWKLKAEIAVESSWPTTSSNIKLLGFFPQLSKKQSGSDLWIVHCRSMFRAAILLSQQYNITFQGQYLTYEEILTDNDVIMTFNQTCQKVSTSNIVGFVGPAYSNEARYIASFAYRLGILDVSYATTSPDLSTIDTGAFYRISPSDEKTVYGIKILFQQYKWKSCIIVYQNDEYGYNGMHLLRQKLNEIHIKTFETIKFDKNQQNFQIDFKKTLLNSLSRIVIVWANKISTTTILNKAWNNNLIGEDFLWILTTTIPLEYFNPVQQQKLIGILTIQPTQEDIVNTTLLNEVYKIWKNYEFDTFPGINNISIYALFTFDATWSLILSLQELCSIEPTCLQFMNVSDCYNRRFLNSKYYYNIMKAMKFLGVSGQVKFSNETSDRVDNISYVIKNIQPLNTTTDNKIDFIPVLQWNGTSTKWIQYKNQSINILWPNRSTNVLIDHKLIQGQQLRIAIIESPPSIILKNSTVIYNNMIENYKIIDITEFDGFYKDLILYLQDKMGFIPVIMLAKPTIRYDELVGGVANDSFDIVMSSIDINAKRNQIVDFSVAIMPASYRIIVRKTESIRSYYLILLKPFVWALWLLLLIIIPYTNVLLWLVEQKNEKNEDEHSLIGIFIVISYPIYRPLSRSHSQIKTNAGQYLSSILFCLQIILLVIHTAGLISFLMIRNPKLTISGIDDIKNGIIPRNRIGILVGSQIEEYYLNSISQGKKDYYPLKTPDEVYTGLMNGYIDASLWSNISSTYHVNNMYCDLMTVGIAFSHSFYQIPIRRGWLYTADLNSNILSFMESEEIDRISAKWFGRSHCVKTNLFDTETKTIVIKAMSKIFITIALMSIISIFIHFITRVYRKHNLILPDTISPQFVLIDLSIHLSELASAMLETLCSLAKDSILNFVNNSTIDFDKLPKKTTFLFVSSKFAATMKIKDEQIEKVFILEENKSRIDNQERFATGEDLIFLLADEIYRCYNKEAKAYFESGDLLKANRKEEQANQIHNELKKTHKRFFRREITIDISTSTITRIIWLKSKLQNDIETERIKNLLDEIVSSFLVFDNLSDCCEYLHEHETSAHIFLIIDTDYDDLIVNDFRKRPNMKIVCRYGKSSSNNETTIDNYSELCFRLIHDLITHYNKLGTNYSNKKYARIAKEMFIKAHKLCKMDLEF